MKKVILKPLIVLILVSVYLCCKEPPREYVHDIFENYTYHLEGTCIDMRDSIGRVIYEERDVFIYTTNFIDTTISIDGVLGNKFKVFNFNDSLLIPIQYFTKKDGNRGSFQGKGKIKNDSLFLYYIVNADFGFFECDCKGKQVR